MGFWRSLRRWWSWDGSPDTDPFREPAEDAGTIDVSGHAQPAAAVEAEQPAEGDDS